MYMLIANTFFEADDLNNWGNSNRMHHLPPTCRPGHRHKMLHHYHVLFALLLVGERSTQRLPEL